MTKALFTLGIGAAALFVPACDIIGVDQRRELGYLGDSGIGISVPDTVVLGAFFDVTIPVYGSGSCTSVDEVQVEYTDAGATLRPFVKTRGRYCTDDLHRFNATGTLQLNRRGTAEIRVHARYGTLDAGSRHTVRDTTVVSHTFVR